MFDTTRRRIELTWADGFEPLVPSIEVYSSGNVVALWHCPVCDAPTHRRHGPGRSRVYCTNACRQRAYRWRRRCRDRLRPVSRPGRSVTREGVHAERHPSDPVGFRRTTNGRQVTACGAFARRASDTPQRFAHTTFIPGEQSCQRCRDLLGLTTLDAAESARAAQTARTAGVYRATRATRASRASRATRATSRPRRS